VNQGQERTALFVDIEVEWIFKSLVFGIVKPGFFIE
jgi:hypothetical protein